MTSSGWTSVNDKEVALSGAVLILHTLVLLCPVTQDGQPSPFTQVWPLTSYIHSLCTQLIYMCGSSSPFPYLYITLFATNHNLFCCPFIYPFICNHCIPFPLLLNNMISASLIHSYIVSSPSHLWPIYIAYVHNLFTWVVHHSRLHTCIYNLYSQPAYLLRVPLYTHSYIIILWPVSP